MTVQYQGVWSLQSAAQLQSTQRWVTDPLFDYTTLLLQADDAANGAQNNTFLDSSSNNFAITRNGNTTQGSFTPFSLQPGAWSTFFPGASSLIVPAGSAFAYGTGAFTVEAWINPYTYQAGSSTGGQIITQTTSGQNYFVVQLGAAGELNFTFGSGGGTTISTTSGSIPLGRWTHIAVVREGTGASQLKLYVNGFLLQSGTCSFDFTNTTYNPTVGNYTHDSAQLPFGGHISNLRVVKGVAVYTGNFLPSALPLTATQSAGINTAAITGTQTSLLTAQSNRFLDNSVANAGGGWTVTLGGTPSVQAFSPFAPQFQWTPSVIGGSGYFDGTTDFLSVATNAALTVTGNVDACFEAWIYPTATPGGTATILQKSGISGSVFSNYEFGFSSSRLLVLFGGNSGSPGSSVFTLNGATTLPLNAWSHVVGTKRYVGGGSVNEYRVFVNGKLDGFTTAANISDGNAQAFTVGALPSGTAFTGYISGSRVFNTSIPASYQTTSTTVGTQIFTSPTAPATAGTASILCNFTNAGIYDGTMKNNLETVGNAQVSTAVVKYGSGSMYFDGTGDNLFAPFSQNLQLGTGDFTIEFWINASASGTYNQVVGTLVSGTEAGTWRVGNRYNSTNTVYFARGNGAGFEEAQYTVNVNDGAWHHVACVRLAGVIYMYVDGVARALTAGSASISGTCSSSNAFYVGYNGRDNSYITGYLDDIRITRGIARYTQNFIPPSVALPRQ